LAKKFSSLKNLKSNDLFDFLGSMLKIVKYFKEQKALHSLAD
jgi:hypothetical protein